MSSAKVESLGEGRFRIQGALSFETANDLLDNSIPLFAGAPRINIDLSGVSEADSAGLALLLEWMRRARISGQDIRFIGLPAQLQALARISEIDDLLLSENAHAA